MEASSQVPEAILKLVERYEFHQAAYKRGQFNETQLRREFVDPFFKTLGWDVNNTKGYSELYKEVIHEDPIRILGSTEFIDYAFRIGGSRKFIVEAKKPAVNIKDDASPALQIRRYAWNARLPLAILTDFEEFAVYDCTKKPMPGDSASTARIAYFTFKEYPEKWNWIASIFSQESILQGSFDRFATETKGKKGTATVDEAILADIEEWRDVLAKNIALRNTALSVDELNIAVQKTIDRLLFLRICEDRGIEEYGCLQKLLEGEEIYPHLVGLFLRADTRYNSGLFHFNAEAGWDEMPDSLTPGLIIDDAVLKKIIKRLYYPESPYEFSVISPVILGQVYEQFLGKVIRLTQGHQAKVEYKPEVKKAGGVYYTPQYIVDYIVQHTVGELVKDKTPREVATLRILDPACGSGSFLLGAYQFLLDWHLSWYIHNLVPVIAEKGTTSQEAIALLPESIPKTGKKKSSGDTSPPIYKPANGSTSRVRSEWKLTIAERKRILLNNVYGVDIDTQAVEVTKLSLLLKVLEEESQENVPKQLTLFEERVLPSLHQNIKCGNSLIGTDIYADMQVSLDDMETVKRINAFDWDRAFPEIMQRGGFDTVIGNPPYVRMELLKEFKLYFQKKFYVYQGRADLYCYFIEKGLGLQNKNGILSFIVANKWMKANYGQPLRKLLLKKQIREIIDFGELPVFNRVSTYPCIINVKNDIPFEIIKVVNIDSLNFQNLDTYKLKFEINYPYKNLNDSEWTLGNEKQQNILKKLKLKSISLNDYIQGKICWGIKTGLNEAFVIDTNTKNDLISKNPRCSEIIKPFLTGKDINRYFSRDKGKYLIYTYHGVDINLYPEIMEYLTPFKEKLKKRATKQAWYELQQPQYAYLDYFRMPKIIVPSIVKKAACSFDDTGFFTNNKTAIISTSDYYLIGILNSKISDYFVHSISSTKMGGYYEYHIMYVSQIPIRTINFSDPADKARHDKIVALVERMLALHKKRAEVKIDHEKNLIEGQIDATDKQIDALVYELYGLTEEEIGIVEGVGK